MVPDHDVAAGVDPGSGSTGDVDDVVALAGGELAGPHAPSARLADHVGRPVRVEPVEVLRHGGQRDQQSPWNVSGAILVFLAHVDHESALGDTFGEGGHLDL